MSVSLILALAVAAASPGCNSPRSQADMNRCSDLEYRTADAKMSRQWRVTQMFMKGLDAKDKSRGGGFGYWAALLGSQRAWLTYRDAQCVIEAGRYAGGSIQPMASARCKTNLTRARTTQLQQLAKPE